MIPTRRFWVLAAGGVPLGAFMALVGSPWMAWAYDAALVLAAYLSFRLGPNASDLRLTRRFDPVLSVRVPNRIEIRLENDGPEALTGRLRDEPPPRFEATNKEFPLHLGAGRSTEYTYHLTPDCRGSDYFRGTFLRLKCPFGLVEKEIRLRTEQPARVYPNVLALREFDLLKQQGRLRQMGIRKSRTRGLGTEFESLREYADGDDFRKIDWKATARKGKLVVRQFETERNQAVLICVDAGRRMLAEADGVTKLDHTLDSLLMLAHAAFAGGDLVGLLVYADVVKRYIPPRKGRNHLGAIIEAIHDLLAEPVESDPAAAFAFLSSRWKRRSLLVSFTDIDDEECARAFVSGMSSIPRRHLTLVARVADPGHRICVETPIREDSDLFQKASTLLLLADRKRAGSVLETSKIHSLEAEPQDLSSELVNFYFMVKERSLV